MIRLWWNETLRLVWCKRFLAVFPAFALATLLALANLLPYFRAYNVQVNVWDGVFGTMADWLYFRFIILLVFVFLTADTLVQDTSSNWSWLVLPRTNSRLRWWTAKVLSLFSAALIYFIIGFLVVFAISATQLPYAPNFSKYATQGSSFNAGVGTLKFPEGANPFVLSAKMILYSAFSSAIFIMIPVTISIVVRQGYVALLIPFVWIFLSMFWQTNNFIFSIDLIPRLFYGSYFSSFSSRVINLSTSLIYLSLVGIACYLAGGYMIKRTDF